MASLRETQQAFAAGLLGTDEGELVLGQILADRFAPRERMQVYRNNLFISLREALAAVFPSIHSLVGEDFFAATAREFSRQHPPHSGNLHDFGREFGDFLSLFPPAASLPYLADVARLEWAWHECYHAAEPPPFDFAALGRVPAEQYERLRFTLQAAVRLVESKFPVVRIWEVNQPDYGGDQTVDLNLGAQQALVARVAGDVVVQQIGVGSAQFIRAIAEARPLSEAAEIATAAEAEFDLNQALRNLVSQNVIVEFEL